MSAADLAPTGPSDAVDTIRRAFQLDVPVVGVFGQMAGWSNETPDPVLKAAQERLGFDVGNWGQVLTRNRLPTEFFAWLSERFTRRAPSPAWEQMGDAPLSAVFTSSIDPGVASIFATNGRAPEPIILGEAQRAITRSRRRPPVYFLFGRSDSGIAEGAPPADLAALAQRRARHANAMLRNLADAATGLGVIVIDGFAFGEDWLRAEDLIGILINMPVGNIVWCGEEPTLSDSDKDLYSILLESGVVVRDRRSFAHLLALARASGDWPTEEKWDEPEVVSLQNGRQVVTTPRLRLATQASATIIDDSWTGFLTPSSPDLLFSQFQSFHAVPSSFRSLADGIRRGFSIVRDFEKLLDARVDRAISRHADEAGALILHGQSGVGKTIALTRLALRVRQARLAAVLMSAGRFPQATDVSDFLASVDKADGVALLVIDANVSVNRYDELLRALRSRGHRVVVIGTTYRVEESLRVHGGRFIEASATLSATERDALIALASQFAPDSKDRVTAHATSEHALVRFYWDLPASRGRLFEGLGREARSVERELRSRGGQRRVDTKLGDLGRALVEAGFQRASEVVIAESAASGAIVGDTPADRVIDYVMAVSRLYQAVPISLVLRAVMSSDASAAINTSLIRELFEGLDLFRWRFSDEEGQNLLISSRLQIEAQFICDVRLGGPLNEARKIIELIRNAYRAGDEGNEETKFLQDIAYSLGPDGPARDRYRDAYAEIARTLTELRQKYGVQNARLMLQESTLRRAYVKRPNINQEEKAILLDEASRAIDDALQATQSALGHKLYASKRTRDNLWVERAATYGFLATDSAQRKVSGGEIWSSYLAAREAVRHATGRVDTYFPLDIGLWLPTDILRDAENLDVSQRVELRADIESTLDLIEPNNLDPGQYERFQQQRLRSAEALSDTELSDDAFAALESIGSTAGYYIKARSMMPLRPDRAEVADSKAIEQAKAAAEYLERVHSKIVSDPRCLNLQLSAEWLRATGRWLFRGLRQPLPYETSDQVRIRRIVIDLIATSPDYIAPRYRYLEAVLNWLTNDEASSIASWRSLARDTEYVESSRVQNRHVITDRGGKPQLFEGVVARKIGENRWSVFVPKLNRHVDFIEKENARGEELSVGRTVREFGISFNYIGPLADLHLRRSA
jgi:hypothetical protein